MNALIRQKNFIGGHWVDADDAQTVDVINPATGSKIGTVPNGGASETEKAIAAAAHAFESWRNTTALERANLMLAVVDIIEARHEELAHLLTEEQGKPIAEAKGEVGSSAAYLRWFAEEARRVYGDVVPSPIATRRIMVIKEPIGVVGAITPWNFPSSMIGRKLGAALAAGCTMVIKPSELTPYSGLIWGDLCKEAGIPDGVVNIVTGDSKVIGKELCENPIVRKISFTGSTRVGKILAEQSASTVKKMSLELGGNAPFLVFDDADIEQAVSGAMAAKYRNMGQTCVCANRFYVQEGIHDQFVKRLVEESEAMRVGDGSKEEVDQGPLVSQDALEKVEDLVSDMTSKGARVKTGAKRHSLGLTYYEPTVIEGVTQDMRIAREEVFGPVTAVFKFSDEADAVAMANDTEYGLAAFVYTQNLGRGFRMMERLKYGLIGINEGVISTPEAPFGGVKESGMGKEGGRQGIEDYLDTKYICLGGLGL
ncbi:MAG: NAD-dependent succinate-semialdehyde dehydrogenase [Pseudomonadota bacterium]